MQYIRNRFLFSLLFYLLFSHKLSVSVSDKVVSYKQESTVFVRLSITNIDKRLQNLNSEPPLIHFQLKMEDGTTLHVRDMYVIYVLQTIKVMKSIVNNIPCERYVCSLCLQTIKVMKSIVFNFTVRISKSVEIRKTFIPEIYETFTPYPNAISSYQFRSEKFIKHEPQH